MSAITWIPGDGIGPSITAATLRVLEAAGADRFADALVRRPDRGTP